MTCIYQSASVDEVGRSSLQAASRADCSIEGSESPVPPELSSRQRVGVCILLIATNYLSRLGTFGKLFGKLFQPAMLIPAHTRFNLLKPPAQTQLFLRTQDFVSQRE